MSTPREQFTGAAEHVNGDADDVIEVWQDRELPVGGSRAGRARQMLGSMLAVVLACLVALPSLAPAEAVPRPAPAGTPAAPGDEYWAAGFSFPGLNGGVSGLAFGPDGSLYAGGQFTTAGEVAANYIARWDGAQWHPLGSGMDHYVVNALAVGPDGSLYAGGDFTTAGGVASQPHRPLGRVPVASPGQRDGRIYIADVRALAVGPDGSLYAGGGFTTAGGITVNSIARWDGAQWHPLGSGIEIGTSVQALAFGPDGSLYAGGSFTTAGGVRSQPHRPLGRRPVASPGQRDSGGEVARSVYALAFGPDGSLYAGGVFTTAGGVAANYIARWDGAQWHSLGSGMDDSCLRPGVWAGWLALRRGPVHHSRRGRSQRHRPLGRRPVASPRAAG